MLHVWGCGQFGQHGHGNTKNVSSKDGLLELKDGEKVKLISCGASHSIAVTDNNKLYGWGNNGTQQLGLVAKQHFYLKPVLVPASYCQEDEIVGISCGSRQSFVWTKSGKCFCYGKFGSVNQSNENESASVSLASYLGTLTVKEISCGAIHAIFCLKDGRVLTIGSNNRGQLGNGTKTESKVPVSVDEIPEKVVQVACGNMHTLCLTEENNVYNWGYGPACGSEDDTLTAVMVEFEEQEKLVKLQGGDSHSLALTDNGRVFAWGSNSEGQLGIQVSKNPVKNPVCITELTEKGNCIDIAARDDSNAAVLETGDLYMWGKNLWGVLEGGSSLNSGVAELFKVDLDGVKAKRVSLGSWHVGVIERENGEEFVEDDDNDCGESCRELPEDKRKISGTSETEEASALTEDDEFEQVIKVEIKLDRHRAEDEKTVHEIRSEDSEFESQDQSMDKNNNFEGNILSINGGKHGENGTKGSGVDFVLDVRPLRKEKSNSISKTFSTASLSHLNAKPSTDTNMNNICSFISVTDEESLLKTKTRETRSSKSRNVRPGSQTRKGILSKSFSSDGTFITKLQPRSPVRQGKINFQEFRTSTWNSEMLLEMTASNYRFGTNEKISLQRPRTAAKWFAPDRRSFARSKSMDLLTTRHESSWQLPKLQDKIDRTQSRYSKFMAPTEDRNHVLFNGNLSRLESASQGFSYYKRK